MQRIIRPIELDDIFLSLGQRWWIWLPCPEVWQRLLALSAPQTTPPDRGALLTSRRLDAIQNGRLALEISLRWYAVQASFFMSSRFFGRGYGGGGRSRCALDFMAQSLCLGLGEEGPGGGSLRPDELIVNDVHVFEYSKRGRRGDMSVSDA